MRFLSHFGVKFKGNTFAAFCSFSRVNRAKISEEAMNFLCGKYLPTKHNDVGHLRYETQTKPEVLLYINYNKKDAGTFVVCEFQ